MTPSDVLAYIGLGGALLSYFLGTKGYWSFESVSYQATQVACCAAAFASAAMIGFVPYMMFNVVWASIAVWKLTQIHGARRAAD